MFGNQFKIGSVGVLKHPGYNKGKGGGGGGGGNTTATTYTTNIPEYAKPYVNSMLGAAQSEMFNIDSKGSITGTKPYVPYSTNPEDYVAGFSPLQQSSFGNAAGLALPGQFGQATQMAGASGLGSLGLAGQAANVGNQFAAQATNPYAVQAYMNPYIESSLQPQIDAMRRQYGITGTEQQSRATAAGAFGGSREALMAAENERAKNSAIDAAIKQGYNTAFQNAQGQMQFGAGLGLQGLQSGLAGVGQAGQAAATLGNLGTNQLAAQQGIINTQNLLGTQQQQQQQNIINQAIQDYATAQQYPMLQLANMSNLLRGLPMQSTSTQTYQAAPSMLSQVAGLGAGIAGASQLMKAKGGTVKSYAGGGITSLENRQRLAERLNPQQLQQVIQNKTIPAGLGKDIQVDNFNMAQRAQAAQAAQQAVLNMPDEGQGIDAAQSNLPAQGFADGGIVAFAAGGRPTSYRPSQWTYKPDEMEVGAFKDILAGAINPATNKPWTQAEIAQRNLAEEESAGIKDLTESRLKENEARKSELAGARDRAQGAGFLAAAEQLLSAPGNTGFGKAFGAYGKTVMPELKEIKATERDIAKEKNAIEDAQQAMARARLAGNKSDYKEAKQDYNQANVNLLNAKNENIKAKNAVGLAQAQAGADYEKSIDTQAMANEAAWARASKQGKIDLYNKAVDNAVTQMKNLYPLGAQDPKFKQLAATGSYESATEAYNKELSKYVGINLGGMAAENGVDPTKIQQGADTAGGAKPAPTPAAASRGLPMPKTQKELVVNKVYNTSQGPAMWDGKQFVAQ